ncbi:MAG: ATP-binding protein [Bacteroidales bacterium]
MMLTLNPALSEKVQRVGNIGWWKVCFASQHISCSSYLSERFGLSSHSFSYRELLWSLCKADRRRVASDFMLLQAGSFLQNVYRVSVAGNTIWLHVYFSHSEAGGEGGGSCAVGFVKDITYDERRFQLLKGLSDYSVGRDAPSVCDERLTGSFLRAYSKSLLQFERKFHPVAQAAEVGWFFWFPAKKEGFATEMWYRNLGEKPFTPLDQVIGKFLQVHPEDRNPLCRYLDCTASHVGVQTLEVRVRDNGGWRWIQSTMISGGLDDSSGSAEGVTEIWGINQNITNTRKLKLRNLKIVESVPDCMYRLSRRLVIEEWLSNEATWQSVPYAPAGTSIEALYGEKVKETFGGAVEACLRDGVKQFFKFNVPVNCAKVYLDCTMVPFDGASVLCFLHNATQAVLGKKAIEDLNELNNSLLKNIPAVVYVKDPADAYRYIIWNRMAQNSGIYSRRDVLGATDFDLLPEAQAQLARNDDERLLDTGVGEESTQVFQGSDGRPRYISIRRTLVHRNHKLPLILGIGWDITDKVFVQEELMRAKNRAEESDRLKSAFLANMSHEIRTPLNGIVGFANLLNDNELTPEERNTYSQLLNENSQRLLQLVNDILDISFIESGTLFFRIQPCNLHTLLQEQCQTFSLLIEKDVVCKLSLPEQIYTIETDAHRVNQVLYNLLDNARKFTSSGTITLGYGPVSQNRMEFWVEDTGIGIGESHLRKLFDRFYKVDDLTRGTGLGLSLCKLLVERLGGAITATSTPGEGTRFSFWLPY